MFILEEIFVLIQMKNVQLKSIKKIILVIINRSHIFTKIKVLTISISNFQITKLYKMLNTLSLSNLGNCSIERHRRENLVCRRQRINFGIVLYQEDPNQISVLKFCTQKSSINNSTIQLNGFEDQQQKTSTNTSQPNDRTSKRKKKPIINKPPSLGIINKLMRR